MSPSPSQHQPQSVGYALSTVMMCIYALTRRCNGVLRCYPALTAEHGPWRWDLGAAKLLADRICLLCARLTLRAFQLRLGRSDSQ
eukprot:100040-Pleurochrysis_carterae.AAC.1